MKDEGEATLYNIQACADIFHNGGPDIGVNGKYEKQYREIADRYAAKDRDLARGMIGELFKNERPRGTTYEQYYSKPYVERWNTYQKLLRYRNGRRR